MRKRESGVMSRKPVELEAWTVMCRLCGKPFVRELRGGKWIPVDPKTGERHDCRKSA